MPQTYYNGKPYGGRSKKDKRKALKAEVARLEALMAAKGIKNIEIKYHSDYTAGQTTFYSDAAAWREHLTAIGEGELANERIGRKVFIKHVNLHFHFRAHPNNISPNPNPNPEQFIRIALVRVRHVIDTPDWSVPGNMPLISNVFDMVAGDLDLSMMPYKHLTNKYSNGFDVIWTKLIKVSNKAGARLEDTILKKRVRVMQPCEWGDDTPGGNVGPGQLMLMAWDNQSTTSQFVHPYYTVAWRVSFTDC